MSTEHMRQNGFYEQLEQTGVVPVVVLEREEDAVPLARALVAGGLPVAEVTFRTQAAPACIRAISESCPDVLVGAGTVVNLEQCRRAVSAGARFIVSPGFDEQVIDFCLENEVNLVPGAVTPAELTRLINLGFDVTKFFPANLYGGLAGIQALASVFVGHRFMPTGGVSAENLGDFLSSPAIIAAGGTWMVKPALFANGDFSKVEELAGEAAALVARLRGQRACGGRALPARLVREGASGAGRHGQNEPAPQSTTRNDGHHPISEEDGRMADEVKLDAAIKFGAGRVRCERGLIEQLGPEIARFATKALIIAGPRAWAAVEDKLSRSLESAGVAFELAIWTGWCCYEGVEELAAKARAAGCDEIVGVGGGKICDFAKACAEVAQLGCVNIPTSASTCAPFTCMSVMYTKEGGKLRSWRFDHEIDAVYMDMDVIAACPHRYNAAGILDAMAKKIEMLNGRPEMRLADVPIDVYSAYSMAEFTYDILTREGLAAIDDNRAGRVTKALTDVAYTNVITTGVIANTTKSFKQSELAHVIYDGVRTHFTAEAADAIHGEIVAVGLFCQLYFNGLKDEEGELRSFMRSMDLPLTLGELGIEPTERNLSTIEEYIVNSRHYNSTDPADRQRLHEAVREMA